MKCLFCGEEVEMPFLKSYGNPETSGFCYNYPGSLWVIDDVYCHKRNIRISHVGPENDLLTDICAFLIKLVNGGTDMNFDT